MQKVNPNNNIIEQSVLPFMVYIETEVCNNTYNATAWNPKL